MFSSLRLNTKLIGSSLGVALVAGLLAWAAWNGLATSQDQLKKLFSQSQKQKAAATVNSDFQMVITKAKNFAILKDEGNRQKTATHFKELRDDNKDLQALAETDDEKKIFEAIGKGIDEAEPRILALLSNTKSTDKAEDLYNDHLKGVTEKFDEAIGSYVVALDAKVGTELAEKIARTKMLLLICLALVFAGLGVSLAVALGVSKSLEEMISALNEGVNQVASASSQVAGTSQQLAEGASESASSLEETSSSMEEMASMTRQNSDNASRANGLMEESRTMVQKGSDSVLSTLKSMREMNESAEKVSRIIKTIEEIAFQTNLLALNAAVEAARAGEHGRGFAVVAEEVRNLASRSASAAKDTAVLIEENARRAGVGMQVSEEAGKALKEIVESSGKVAGLVSDIASASSEQSRGIGEINSAVSQMDKVTQRVTANAEELSSSSEEMSSQAMVLRDLVSRLVRMVEGSEAAGQTLAPAAPAPRKQEFQRSFLAPSHVNGNGHALQQAKPAREFAKNGKGNHDDVLPLGKDALSHF